MLELQKTTYDKELSTSNLMSQRKKNGDPTYIWSKGGATNYISFKLQLI